MKVLMVLALLSSACVEERASAPDEREEEREDERPGAEREAGEDAVRLGVPAQTIHRARREAIGLVDLHYREGRGIRVVMDDLSSTAHRRSTRRWPPKEARRILVSTY